MLTPTSKYIIEDLYKQLPLDKDLSCSVCTDEKKCIPLECSRNDGTIHHDFPICKSCYTSPQLRNSCPCCRGSLDLSSKFKSAYLKEVKKQ